ncbi:MAG TPA: Mpo1-like protein [Candidatus Thermoplasmatota archaeon]|nr:Mpo1-like protein [Candidatus Thermoplasmatota archaeon]
MKSLQDQMATYAAYHQAGSNKAIHFLFVPLIVWSGMGLLSVPGAIVVGGLAVTLAHVAALALLAYYLRLDFPLGLAMVALFTFLLVTALQVRDAAGAMALPFFAGVFVLSWAAQLVGHRFFEGRKPALADNLWQVFVAPIFVVAEWAFALGLRRKLHDQVEAGVPAHMPRA